MCTRFIFLRHGQSEANVLGCFGGQKDYKLTTIGKIQANIVAEYIFKHYHIDSIYASTLSRAYETAESIAKYYNLPVNKDARFCEINGGKWETMKFSDIEQQYPEEFAIWRGEKVFADNYNKSGRETFLQVQQRGLEAINQIADENKNKNVLIVTHRVFLRCLQCYWEKRRIEDIYQCKWLSNCSVSELIFKSGELLPVNIGKEDFLGDNITKVLSKI